LDGLLITKLGYIPTLRCVSEKFGKTLTFVTFNLTKGEKEYLAPDTYPNLLVTDAIRMSSTFPFIFSPYEYNGNYYIDGGIVENFPMMTAQLTGKKCFGVYNSTHVKPYTPQVSYFEFLFNLVSVFISSSADNTLTLPGSETLKLSYKPSFFNFTSSNSDLIKMFDDGYDACVNAYAK
jgi:predicted acylesterase/phospholipase RssA